MLLFSEIQTTNDDITILYNCFIAAGKVTEVSRDERTRTIVATVEPAANLGSISKVMIITEYEITSLRGE